MRTSLLMLVTILASAGVASAAEPRISLEFATEPGYPIAGHQKLAKSAAALDVGALRAEDVVCVIGKTEGNGLDNDHTRAFATTALARLLGGRLGRTRMRCSTASASSSPAAPRACSTRI